MQAAALLAEHANADPAALRAIQENHPRFLDSEVKWKPLPLTAEAIAAAPFDIDDARLAIALVLVPRLGSAPGVHARTASV